MLVYILNNKATIMPVWKVRLAALNRQLLSKRPERIWKFNLGQAWCCVCVFVHTHVGNVSPVRQFPGDLWPRSVCLTPTSESPAWLQPWWETPNLPVPTQSCIQYKHRCTRVHAHTSTLAFRKTENKRDLTLEIHMLDNQMHTRVQKAARISM